MRDQALLNNWTTVKSGPIVRLNPYKVDLRKTGNEVALAKSDLERNPDTLPWNTADSTEYTSML